MKGNPSIWNLTLTPWSIKKGFKHIEYQIFRKTGTIFFESFPGKKILKESFEIPKRKIVESFKDNSTGFNNVLYHCPFAMIQLDEKLKNLPRKISTSIYYYYFFFFLSFEIKLFKRCYLRTRRTRLKKKPIEDAFYAEQRSKREHKNQSSSRGQAKGSIVAILASKLLSLSRLYIQFHLPRRLPPPILLRSSVSCI